MELIDNINRLLGDDLKQTLKPGARLKIAASCWSNAKALNQIWATDLTEEVKPKIDVGQPFALDLTQVVKPLTRGTRHESSL